MQLKKILLFFLPIIFFSSCVSVKQIGYFQDLHHGNTEQKIVQPIDIKIKSMDKISIVVHSHNSELAGMFNLPIISSRVGGISNTYNSSNNGICVYTVDQNGDIDFPVLGKINVAGKKREEIASFIKNELINKNLLKDPIVTVEYNNLYFSVLGEVKNPGRYRIDRDRITLLDAISKAGDLTIYGKRENVLVLREKKGIQYSYEVNLCSSENVHSSPAYYLQQNDILYIEPNSKQAGQSTVNGNNIRSTSFWLSLASVITTISVLIFK